MTTPIDKFLQKCDEVRNAATPGPWINDFTRIVRPHGTDGEHWAKEPELGLSKLKHEDARFIAFSHNNDARKDEMIRIAVEALSELKLGHEHAPDLPHTRAFGKNYGWCDFCSTEVNWGPGIAEEALDAINKLARGDTDPHPGRSDSCL